MATRKERVGRFLVFLRGERLPFLGLYARGLGGADGLVKELGLGDVKVLPYSKPSGWTDNGGLYLTKNSALGVCYWCKACGRQTLGLGLNNHATTCNYRESNHVKP